MKPPVPWDLYRTFEMVVRRGTFGAAAKTLGASQSTVSRHIAELEASAGAALLERASPVRPTEQGRALLVAIGPMVEAATAARAAIERAPEIDGEVVLTTVAEALRWVLAPLLPALFRAHPRIRLDVRASNQVHSLAADEADLALRMARPERGELVARRLSKESFGFFAPRGYVRDPKSPWVGLGGSLHGIPEQRHARRAFAGRAPRLLAEDLEALAIAIAAGVGVGVLPRGYAGLRGDLVEIAPADAGARDLGPIPQRSFWLVVHRSKRDVPRVRAVADWLVAAFAR